MNTAHKNWIKTTFSFTVRHSGNVTISFCLLPDKNMPCVSVGMKHEYPPSMHRLNGGSLLSQGWYKHGLINARSFPAVKLYKEKQLHGNCNLPDLQTGICENRRILCPRIQIPAPKNGCVRTLQSNLFSIWVRLFSSLPYFHKSTNC